MAAPSGITQDAVHSNQASSISEDFLRMRQQAYQALAPLFSSAILCSAAGPNPALRTSSTADSQSRAGQQGALRTRLYRDSLSWHESISAQLDSLIFGRDVLELAQFLDGEDGDETKKMKEFFADCTSALGRGSTSLHTVMPDLVRVALRRTVQPCEKVKAVYGIWMVASMAVCRVTAIPEFQDYGIAEISFLRLLKKTSHLILGVPQKLSVLFEHLEKREEVFTEKGVLFLTWLDKDRGDWTLRKVSQLPFGVLHNACIGVGERRHDEIESTPITKARYHIESFSASILRMMVVILAVIQTIYILTKTAGDLPRARERYYSTTSALKKWEADNVYLDDGKWRGDEAETDVNIYGMGSLCNESERDMLGTYANQGLVLYADYEKIRRRGVGNAGRLIRLYTPASAKTHLVGLSARDARTRLGYIRYVGDGGRVSSSALSLIVVWLYIILAVTISVLASTLNWADRENILERVSDGVWVVTSLLISVFGLVKLTSEDPNAIRHALTGYKVLLKPRDVYEYLCLPNFCDKANWEHVLKGVVAMYPNALEWMSSHETCYASVEPIGNMRLAGGLRVQTAVGFGLLPSKQGVINALLNKRFLVQETHTSSYLHIKRKEVSAQEVTTDDIITVVSDRKYGSSENEL